MLKKNIYLFVIIAVQFLIVFYPMLSRSNVLFVGNDAIRSTIPSREYFYTTLHQGHFPFWVEYMSLGYPAYADLERGYLNPLNIILVYLFGPYISLHLLIFITYLFGSFGLYKLIERHGGNLLGFTCANAIYFFNFYMLFHMEHLAILLTAYLLPLGLYLFSEFRKNTKKLVVLALFDSYIFFIGSFQLLFLSLIARVVYYFVFIYEKKCLSEDIKKMIFYLILVVALILPAFLSSFELYRMSDRKNNIDYMEGSLTPLNLVNGAFPFIYGVEGYFNGIIFCKDCTIQETYFYFGITTIIIFVFAILHQANKKITKWVLILFSISIFLAVIRYVPILNSISLFPINLFRYWPRGLILLLLSTSFSVGLFLSQDKNANLRRSRIYPFITVLFFMIVLQVVNSNIQFFKDFYYYISNSLVSSPRTYFLPWLWLFLAVLINIFFLLIWRGGFKYFKYSMSMIILIDIFMFAVITIQRDGFIKLKELPSQNDCLKIFNEKLLNQRVLDLSGCINSKNAHASGTWSILGTTQLSESSYLELIEKLGIGRTRSISPNEALSLLEPDKLEVIKSSGVQYIFSPSKEIMDLNNPLVRLLEMEYIYKYPGYLDAKFYSNKNVMVNTYIRYNPNWQLKINGIIKNIKADYFIKFDVDAGQSEITLRFIPKTFLVGLFISTILLLAEIYYYRKYML